MHMAMALVMAVISPVKYSTTLSPLLFQCCPFLLSPLLLQQYFHCQCHSASASCLLVLSNHCLTVDQEDQEQDIGHGRHVSKQFQLQSSTTHRAYDRIATGDVIARSLGGGQRRIELEQVVIICFKIAHIVEEKTNVQSLDYVLTCESTTNLFSLRPRQLQLIWHIKAFQPFSKHFFF